MNQPLSIIITLNIYTNFNYFHIHVAKEVVL